MLGWLVVRHVDICLVVVWLVLCCCCGVDELMFVMMVQIKHELQVPYIPTAPSSSDDILSLNDA